MLFVAFCFVSLSVFRLVVEIVVLLDFHQVSFIEETAIAAVGSHS